MRPDRLELLASYDADAIQSFLATRKSEVIPPDMCDYILQLDSLAKIFHYHKNSQSRAIEALRKQWPTLTISQAREIYRGNLPRRHGVLLPGRRCQRQGLG